MSCPIILGTRAAIKIRLVKKYLAIFTSSGNKLGKWLSKGDKKCPSKILHSFCSVR